MVKDLRVWCFTVTCSSSLGISRRKALRCWQPDARRPSRSQKCVCVFYYCRLQRSFRAILSAASVDRVSIVEHHTAAGSAGACHPRQGGAERPPCMRRTERLCSVPEKLLRIGGIDIYPTYTLPPRAQVCIRYCSNKRKGSSTTTSNAPSALPLPGSSAPCSA